MLVDVPRDVQTALIDFEEARLTELQPLEPDAERVAAAATAINKAQSPVMLVGGGVINANAEYDAMHLCEKLHIPVVSTLMGIGAISAYRQLFLGMTGLHGHERANNAVKEADLILAVGSRFNDRVTGERSSYSANKLIIHLDIDPAEVDKNIDSGIGITGDMVATLNALEKAAQPHDLSSWWDKINSWPGMDDDFGNEEAPKFFKALNPVLKDKDYIITTDVGQHQMMAARYFKFNRSRSIITSGGLGTMGFGLPAAIGAKLAVPEREVCLFVGDGGFQMNIQELATVFQTGAAVKVILLNNGYLGMVRQWQELFFNHRYSFTQMLSPDFGLIAKANGIEYSLVEQRGELDDAVSRMLMHKGPYVMEVRVENEENVFPMVPAGAELSQIMLE